MLSAPLSPASRRFHVASPPQPSGVTIPSPVTTTRLIPVPCYSLLAPASQEQTNRAFENTESLYLGSEPRNRHGASTGTVARCSAPSEHLNVVRTSLALCVFFEELDCIADGQDRLGGVVGDFASELFLERHHQFDGVEAIGAEVVDEARGLGHLLGFDAKVLHDDLFDPLGNVVTHRFHPRIL